MSHAATREAIDDAKWAVLAPTGPPGFKDQPFAYHTELTMDIQTVTNDGHGIGRVELPGQHGKTWVVMVRDVIAGERVRVKIYRNFQNYSFAVLTEVLEASPNRIEPQCKLFGACGGCQYQHMTLEAQRELKRGHVQQVLHRLAGLPPDVQVNPVLGTGDAFGYRSKLTPHYDRPRRDQEGGGPIGFNSKFSRQIVDVPHCPIALDAINDQLPQTRQEVVEKRRRAVEAERHGIRKARGGTLLLRATEQGVVTDPRQECSEKVGRYRFWYTAGSFFQNNPFVLPRMVEYVNARLREPLSDGAPPRFLLDCYCGVGLFAICGHAHLETVVGVEVQGESVEAARRNAAENGANNCRFVLGNAQAIFGALSGDPSLPAMPSPSMAVVIDPPRKGCDRSFLRQLFRLSPARVVYVSCNPATQARDTIDFLGNGYRIDDIQPVDIFPQTKHIENIITFANERPGVPSENFPSSSPHTPPLTDADAPTAG
ncbi:unnamed protein product [Vitrella brassicaformis CCMP3155]|uniref:TRAM domain-containing protein n=2 Tax=Vitrella brassicaformis TaxID=1169539 RepID=A0A0G4ELN4_VITBC|nr:unnamed protein product [Vitrella brassicaformis CCMP3155]|eukprot:CEL97929.1 unnamed protein product [Vitrella brassicaformis CCMP3155]